MMSTTINNLKENLKRIDRNIKMYENKIEHFSKVGETRAVAFIKETKESLEREKKIIESMLSPYRESETYIIIDLGDGCEKGLFRIIKNELFPVIKGNKNDGIKHQINGFLNSFDYTNFNYILIGKIKADFLSGTTFDNIKMSINRLKKQVIIMSANEQLRIIYSINEQIKEEVDD
jgi:hypothetical protein